MGRAYWWVALLAGLAFLALLAMSFGGLLLGAAQALNRGEWLLGAGVAAAVIGGLAWFFWDIHRDGKG